MTLMVAGVPAALYERLAGGGRSSSTSAMIWFGGVLATGSIGHRSWRLVMGALSVQFLRLDALLAAAVWIFTCLVVGASVVISGRRMLRPFVGMAVGATVLSCAVTAVWFVGGNVGF